MFVRCIGKTSLLVMVGFVLVSPGVADVFRDLGDPHNRFIESPRGPNAAADLTWYDKQGDFEAAAAARGHERACIEDFEESTLEPGRLVTMPEPLCHGTPNPPYFPDGLTCENVCVQANTLAGAPEKPSPRGGPYGLAVVSAGYRGSVSDLMIGGASRDSFDIIFADGCCQAAIGGNTIDTIPQPDGVEIRVYDVDNNFLGMKNFDSDFQGTHFAGVIAEVCIGRINVYNTARSGESLDNIQLWCAGEPGGKCNYTIKKSKPKGGCESCPAKGSRFKSEQGCQQKKDCRKKVKTRTNCPQGKGACKIKAKKRRCG